jgi:hypothetical protein
MNGDILQQVLAALGSSVDRDRFQRAMAQLAPAPAPAAAPHASHDAARDPILSKLVLGDVLDDSILGARNGDPSFPLRLFFAELGTHLSAAEAFTFASGVSFYFRAEMDEEAKVALGFEVSRAFYDFGRTLDRALVVQTAPLMAQLLSTELPRVSFETVDSLRIFDSGTCERGPGSDPTKSSIVEVSSFLCRVAQSALVKRKALVRT